MNTTRTPRLLAFLATIAFLWACDEEPSPAKTTFPLSSAPENVQPADMRPAGAMKGPGHRFGHGDPMLGAIKKHADELELSEEQRAGIESIIEKAREEAPPMKGQFKAHMKQMAGLIKADALDEEALTAMHDEMQARHQEMRARSFSTFLDALELLSQDQRIQLFAIVKEHRGHKGRFKHKGMHSMLLRAIKVMGDDLGETPEQKQSLEALFESSRADAAPLRDKKKALHVQMRELMTAPQLDRAAIEAKHAEIMAVKKEKGSKRFALTLASLKVLTVDQRVQLITTLEQCRASKGEETCKKLFGHRKGKHLHKAPPHMASW